MNNDNQFKIRKRALIIVAIIFLAVCAFAIWYYLFTMHNNMIVITNIDSCAERLPASQRDTVFRQLYPFIREQNSVNGIDSQPTYHAVIRDNTCRTKDYERDGLRSSNARFILDIEELNQSYRVSFNWIKTGDPQSPEIDLGSTNVNCLLEEYLIYGDFNCDQNPLIQASNSGREPILSLIPYFGDGFSLSPTLSATSKSGYSIILTFDPPQIIYLEGPLEPFLESRRTMMRQFLQDNDINIDEYGIIENFRITR
ncbi:hypothetical protein FWF89_02080 [Candidatus Saccharibacteria bacterium]|nr:hypothetical protein [Candidatus Saccharibacteria bacterium]